MKNPYKTNFILLSVIIISLGFLLLGPCLNEHYCFVLSSTIENILLGILSAAILLLLLEIINYFIDRNKYDFIKGKYKKQFITQKNEGGVRSSDFPKGIVDVETRRQQRKDIENRDNIKFLQDSCYHELSYYQCDIENYYTNLEYKYHGIYTGFVEYYDHALGNWRENKIVKSRAHVTLTLNLANRMTGTGTYKYMNKDDFGRFEFQIDEQNTDRIIVTYVNTIPSGLAEGYEIWERYKSL